MKNKLKKIVIILVIVLTVFIIIFFNRIQNSYSVYSLVNNVTYYLNEGSENYNLQLTGTIGSGKSTDSINVAISYNGTSYFLANVNFKNKHYIVKSEKKLTQVYMGTENLIVSATGGDKGNFDAIKLLGEILKNYPQYSKIPTLDLKQKFGIAGWAISNSNFSENEKNGEVYTVISNYIDSTEVQLWIEKENQKKYYLISDFSKYKINMQLTFTDKPHQLLIPKNEETKIIDIERKELNTAIYRGALRAGGLLLAKIEIPKVDEVETKYGNGRLFYENGNRVLLAKGTHKELGQIQGKLLKDEIRKMVDATLYTMCWVYTAKSKTWFIDDFRAAYKRLLPFIPQRYQEEMLGMSETSGISLDEIRLTNVFPALFHCSGFAVFNTSSLDGKLYHGRVLDYITGLGLQFSAVVYIMNPEGYNSFANVGYAGFIGSVTGMNEHQVSFGEMGGGGVGDWDGMPMAFLMRDGLERAKNLDEAITIFQETPRTCEYYYVIADGKIPDARGLSTSPTRFDIIKPNQFHIKLNEPVVDAVIMSSGDRYKNLVKRIKNNNSTINAEKAIRLMDRPVAMKSNLHNALFAPQSLEFWVSNAGQNTPACNEPYTHYNLAELLKELK